MYDEIRYPSPRRRRPAAARTSASDSPASSLRNRVSTFPRIASKRAPGISPRSCATRRGLLVAMRGVSPRRVRSEVLRYRRTGRQHQRVPRIFTRENGADHQPVGHLSGHVLRAVDRDVDVFAQQGVFDLLDEHALAARLGKRRFLTSVALRGDPDDFDLGAAGPQLSGDGVGLPERQRAAARADPQGLHQGVLALPAGSSSFASATVSSGARLNSRLNASE